MTSPSRKISPVVLRLIAEVKTGEESTVVGQKERVIGMSEGRLKAKVHASIKLSNVIAKFSTFETGMELEFWFDAPEEVKTKAHQYHNEIIQAIQEFQNETLVKIGRDPAWGDGNALSPHLKAEASPAPTGEEFLNSVLGESPRPKRTPKKG